MLISRARQEDVRFRLEMLKRAGEMLALHEQYKRPAYLELAEQIYEICEAVKKKIESYDYREDDARLDRYSEFDRLYAERKTMASNITSVE